jgi:V/A-type H+-transporting ATPase subunit I
MENGKENETVNFIREQLDRLRTGAEFLGIALPDEPEQDPVLLTEDEQSQSMKLCDSVELLGRQEAAAWQEKRHIEETLNEAQAFSRLNAPFEELDQLSYLTLRLGRLDPSAQPRLMENMGDRAVIIPIGTDGNRILAASSRKARFALDSELKKHSFEPIAIPEGYKGIPPELLQSLQWKLSAAEKTLAEINQKKEETSSAAASDFKRFTAGFLVGLSVERLKTHLVSTASIYLLSGWVAQDSLAGIASGLAALTGGKVAIQTYNPEELAEVRDGTQKVPVSLKHGSFVKGFEGVVFSYGAPLYGTIDPTPLVAVFFTLLFGVMFGDLGQGFVLLLAGLLASKYGIAKLSRFRKYASPLVSVGIASMVMGMLTGSVFTHENLLAAPTRAISAALTGHPVDRFLAIMPLAEHGGSIRKLFLFFAFTVGMGIVLISVGLAINIINNFIMKKYEQALFSKTGLSGLFLMWYALFVVQRCVFGGSFQWFDIAGLLLPCFCIFFGPLLWRCLTRQRPFLEHGFAVFVMEGFVEILETISSYIANIVSFLRVGAFALSHAVLSYIVFRFSEEIVNWNSGPAGSLSALLLMIFGNAVIIVLEGMIVAIQVIRLQYYEFFSKFFTETGMEFSPFRFGKKMKE